jgi:cytochrome c biogenesis factor
MDFELLLLIVATLLILLDITLPLFKQNLFKRLTKYSALFSLTAFILILTSYSSLLSAFARNDFSYASVYSFSSSSSSFLSKIYSSWAGAGGSMLLLTIILSSFYLLLKISTFRKQEKNLVTTAQIMGFVVIIFTTVCLLRNPFERVATVPVEGIGLNPQLQSVWMAIHPPIVFSAYAFVVLAFALTLSSLKNSTELRTQKLFKASTYLSWVLLTMGIALGGLWAYEVLGWGGYWAWDPVETASLLPWLILTAYFFVRSISKSKTSLTQECMIMLTFASLVFLSALTRGGLTQSVHSYAASAVGPVMLAFAVAMMGYFVYVAKKTRRHFFKLDVDKSSLTSRSSFVAFWGLLLISVVCLAGLAFSGFAYSLWTYPFVLLFVIALVGFGLNDKTHYSRQLIIVTAALIAGSALTVSGVASVNPLVTLTTPLMAIALAGLIYRSAKSIRHKTLVMQSFLGIAVVVMLLGVFFSAGAKTSTTLETVNQNTPIKASNLTLTISNISLRNSTSNVYNTQAAQVIAEYSILTTDVKVQGTGLDYQNQLTAAFYPNYGLVIKPLIISTANGDVYIHLEVTENLYNTLVGQYSGNKTSPVSLSITVQENPLIYLVWTGVTLMIVAMTAEFIVDLKSASQVACQSLLQPKVK